jgi:hypothetical protein
MNDLDQQRILYPRVSDIISKQNFAELKAIPLDTLANACIRGTKVHEYCTAYVRNLWIPEVEEEYQPYLDAFASWADENIEDVLHFSTRLYDDVKRFTGEFDMIVKLRETRRLALLDIKTSAVKSKSWPVQLAAYGNLCMVNGYKFDDILNLHLKKTKAAVFDEKEGKKIVISPPLVKTIAIDHGDITPYWEIFSSALKCYDYFDRKEAK